MADVEALIRRVEALETELGFVRDREEIERVLYIYGFYVDNHMWREMADLFTDNNPSVQIGRRGKYEGKERIHRFYHDVLGYGMWGLNKNDFANHIQLQCVTTVDPSRLTAKCRSRALIQVHHPEVNSIRWAEGIYENTFVKDDGVWKIEHMWWAPTFYAMTPASKIWHESMPESDNVQADLRRHPADEALGRIFLPFHYVHPITGKEVPSPSAGQKKPG